MKHTLFRFARTWVMALLPPLVTLAGAWAIAAPLDPEGATGAAFTLAARGVQIYECKAKGEAFEWTFVAPEAELFDASGKRAGTHGAGPHWLALDGSRIEGKVVSRQDAPAAGAIPWLLLQAQGGDGQGSFGRVGYIQRINTQGGLAPAASGCQRASLGQTARVAYTADYRFLERARP